MNKQGVTKIEILVIALVVGVLGLLAVYAVSSARSQTRDAVRISDVRQIQAGLELRFNDVNEYPEWHEYFVLGEPATSCLSDTGFAASCSSGSQTVYLEVVPATPSGGLKEQVSCSNVNNAYCYIGANGEYRLEFELENNNRILGLQKGVNCATAGGLQPGACPDLTYPLASPVTEE